MKKTTNRLRMVYAKPQNKSEKVAHFLSPLAPFLVLLAIVLIALGVSTVFAEKSRTDREIELQAQYNIYAEQLHDLQSKFKKVRCELGKEKVLQGKTVSNETMRVCRLDEPLDEAKAFEFIANWEDFVSDAYEDGDGMSIGYGFHAKGRKHINKKEADRILRLEIKRLNNQLDCFERGFSSNQKIALISLSYNLAGRNLCKMPIFKDLVENDKGAKFWENEFSTIGGKYSKGVNRRRKAEIKLFFNQ